MTTILSKHDKGTLTLDTEEVIYEFEKPSFNLSGDGYGFKFDGYANRMNYRRKEATVTCDTPELYPENLRTLQALMDQVENLSTIDGVFELEIRVRIDDLTSWAVIGWGESGDPCVLRFEKD